MSNEHDLACIRSGTEHDLSDAAALASRIFSRTHSVLDNPVFEFSKELFMAVALEVARTKERGSFNDMLSYLVDPLWDSPKQILLTLLHFERIYEHRDTGLWIKGFLKKIQDLSAERAEILVGQCRIHWKVALSAQKNNASKKSKPRAAGVQVFNQELVANAMNVTGGLKDEKKFMGDRILEEAQINDGYRVVPNARTAEEKLRDMKANFENLAEPIGRLQTGLILAACMKPADFHLTPILLLGEPGIGKTYLATQLAKSLGVPMDKISAGSAQGGFQLTGSHSTWTGARPGSLVSLLAAGKSASPVIVIDEVDKIRDDKYPVLPVLLDLMEPETGREFKDEFLEMQFDASKVIFVLTANSLNGVPESLLSRCEVFNVPRPEAKQRLRIIEGIGDKLRNKTGKNIQLDKSSSSMLAERMDIDLRQVTFLVEDAFAKSILSGETVACIWVPKQGRGGRASERAEANRILH